MDITSLTPKQWMGATTWTGVPLSEITGKASEKWPTKARERIPTGPMSGKTDIKFHYVRQRFEEIFGPQGVAWRMVPDAVLGKVTVTSEHRTSSKGRDYTEWTVTLENYVFEFAVLLPEDGGVVWVSNSPMSDAHSGEDKGYVFRGAETSLLKHVLRGWGGLDSLYESGSEDAIRREDEETTSPTTGLEAITPSTKIADATWGWLGDSDSVDRFWRTFGGKTFADLPDSVTGYLLGKRSLPPELRSYLIEARRGVVADKGAKGDVAASKPADKADAAAKSADGAKSAKSAAAKPEANGKGEPEKTASKSAGPAAPATPPAASTPNGGEGENKPAASASSKPTPATAPTASTPNAGKGDDKPAATKPSGSASTTKPAPKAAKPADSNKGWPGPDMKPPSTTAAPEGAPEVVTEPSANGASAK